MRTPRTTWERLLDALDTTGGHLLILLMLFASGVAMASFGIPKGEDVLIATFAALLVLLKEVHSSHTRYRKDGDEDHEP